MGIAVQFGVDPDLLASENDINDPNDLKVGQELVIPFTQMFGLSRMNLIF